MNTNYTPTREELLNNGTVLWDRDDGTGAVRRRVRLILFNGTRWLMRERDDEVIYIANYEELDAKFGKEG